MNLNPTLDRVIVKPDPEHAPSKIVIPDAARKIANRGTILAVGPGRRHIDGNVYPMNFHPGQKVMFIILRAFKFEHDGEQLVLLEGEDVVCVLQTDASPEHN